MHVACFTSLGSVLEREQVFLSEQAVQARIGLTSLAHEASECDDSVLGAGHLAVFVNLNVSK